MRGLVVVTVALLPVLVVAAADLAFVPAMESRIEDRARAEARSASVEAEVGTFPVVGRALATGEVSSIDITWFAIDVGAIEATSLHLHLDGVGFDRSELFGGQLRVRGVESGDVRMLVSPSQLSTLMGTEVRIHAGTLRVRPTPETDVEVQVSATSQGLVLTAPGIPPASAELDTGQIPCAPITAIEARNLVLSCSFRGLPPILRAG